MKYRKKPVVIEAFRLGIDNIPDWFMNAVTKKDAILHDTNADIKTLEGWLRADYGDYIIQGIKKEIYSCKPDIFEKTYEPIN